MINMREEQHDQQHEREVDRDQHERGVDMINTRQDST